MLFVIVTVDDVPILEVCHPCRTRVAKVLDYSLSGVVLAQRLQIIAGPAVLADVGLERLPCLVSPS